MCNSMSPANRVRVETLAGSTSEYRGNNRTSSNVRPTPENLSSRMPGAVPRAECGWKSDVSGTVAALAPLR